MNKIREIYSDVGPMACIFVMLAMAFLASVLYTTFVNVPK